LNKVKEDYVIIRKKTEKRESMDESYSQSAGRHLMDAKILLDEERWDNALYLAGYVPECSFKAVLELFMDRQAVRTYGHLLAEMQGVALERLRILYPEVEAWLSRSRLEGTVLDEGHPQRRYAKSGIWTEDQAKEAIKRAREIYEETILELVLDGRLSGKELQI
jgi:HEPN domain-containing protein